MKQYKKASITLIPTTFLMLGALDKIVAQTIWDWVDFGFVSILSILIGIFLYQYKNKQ